MPDDKIPIDHFWLVGEGWKDCYSGLYYERDGLVIHNALDERGKDEWWLTNEAEDDLGDLFTRGDLRKAIKGVTHAG